MTINSAHTSLPRDLRNAVRAKLAASPGWDAWRLANLGAANMSSMTRDKTIEACNALGISIAEIARDLGAPVIVSATVARAQDEDEAREDEALAQGAVSSIAQAIADAPGFEGRDPQSLVNEALAPVSDWLSSKAVKSLAASLLPLASAAAQGPRVETKVETRTVTVTVDASGAVIAAPVAPVSFVESKAAREIFADLKAKKHPLGALDIPVCDGAQGEGAVPVWDALYMWSPETLSTLCLVAHLAASNDPAKRRRASALLYGPAGTGKTSGAECFAAACGRPFYRIAFDRTTEPLELVGQRLPAPDGGTVFHEGALVAAMQVPFAVILLDEPSFLRPGSAAVLQTILDKRYLYLKEDSNRRVECAPGVMFLAADNTNLTGDETGRYADTNTQNLALQDRFAWLIRCEYLDPTTEAKALSAQTGLALAACAKLVVYAGLTRHGAVTGTLTTGASFRRLLAWADAVAMGVPSKEAFELAVINPADPADRETLKSLETSKLGNHAEIDNDARGRVADAPAQGVTVHPEGARAAAAFPPVSDMS